jgi:hypothetical protein
MGCNKKNPFADWKSNLEDSKSKEFSKYYIDKNWIKKDGEKKVYRDKPLRSVTSLV